MQISARKKDWPKDKPSVTLEYDMPTDLNGLVAKFGEEAVASNAIDSITISIQAGMRRILDKDSAKTSDEQKQKEIADLVNYKPSGKSAVRRSPQEKIGDLVTKLSPEERAALIAQLKAAA